MTATPLIDDRAAWLEDRKRYLGGSDVASILGKNKYRSPSDVYLEKIGEKVDEVSSRKAEAGIALEPYVRKWISEDLNTPIKEGRTLVDPEFPFLGANIDGETDGYLVEIKTMDFATRDNWGEDGTDEIPTAYYYQVLWYLGMTKYDKAIVVACDRGTMSLKYYTVEADAEIYELQRNIAIRFWQDHIAKRIPPTLTADDADNIIRLFPDSTGEILMADEGTDQLASEMAEVYAQLKPLEKKYEILKAQMKVAIGPAQGIETLHGKFTLARMPGKVSWQKIAATFNPTLELIQQHTGSSYPQLKTPFKEAK